MNNNANKQQIVKDFKLKGIIKKSFFYELLVYYRNLKVEQKKISEIKKIIKEWQRKGKPAPPPHLYKVSIVRAYAAKFHVNILIETGTFFGDMIDACKHIFKKIISIELDKQLFENAEIKFSHESSITILQGDSGVLLEKILLTISEPCLFWLDGHYSEGPTAKGDLNTPILNELKHIFAHHIQNHIILIDDARCFTGDDDYPTIDSLRNLVNESNPNLKFSIEDDIIRIHA